MKKPQYLVLSIVIGIVIALSYAYASQLEDPGKQGEGAGPISGITVSDIHYDLSTLDPSKVEAVEFDVNDFQGTISVKLDSSGSRFFSCSQVSSRHWLCLVNGVSLSNMDEVRVIAQGN